MNTITEILTQVRDDKIMVNDFLTIKDDLLTILNNSINTKIIKIDTSLIAKINNQIRPILSKLIISSLDNNYKPIYCYITIISNSLYLTMKYGFNEDKGCRYKTKDIYLGRVDNQILLEVSNNFDNYTNLLDINEDKIIADIKLVDDLILQAKQIQDDLPYYARLSLPYYRY